MSLLLVPSQSIRRFSTHTQKQTHSTSSILAEWRQYNFSSRARAHFCQTFANGFTGGFDDESPCSVEILLLSRRRNLPVHRTDAPGRAIHSIHFKLRRFSSVAAGRNARFDPSRRSGGKFFNSKRVRGRGGWVREGGEGGENDTLIFHKVYGQSERLRHVVRECQRRPRCRGVQRDRDRARRGSLGG